MDRIEDSNDGRETNTAPEAQNTAADRLRVAVNAAAKGSGSCDELQDAARALVAELRGRAEPPEQMLIQVKRLLADAGLRPGNPANDDAHAVNRQAALYRDLITWSIRFYYDDWKK